MYKNILSIIIPTKNRQQYAFKCVEAMLKFPSRDYEIVIHDNSDDSSLKQMLSSIKDERIVYKYNSDCLSFCANFEKAVELASGDYLIIIGDDDAVYPEIIDLTKSIRNKNIDAVTFPNSVTYFWPNALGNEHGKLIIRKQKPYIKKLKTDSAINRMVQIGNYDYQQYAFPKVYHGIVKREKFDKVKQTTGQYFGGLTPDIYSAVSLSFYIDEIVYINYPFTIAGTCAKSGSADSITGRHTGELRNAPHFRGHISYMWDDLVPNLYSIDTIWAETAIKACNDNGKKILFSNKNYLNLATHIGLRSKTFKRRLAESYVEFSKKSFRQSLCIISVKITLLKMNIFTKKSFSRLKQILSGRYVYLGINDIESALIKKNEIENMKKHLKY